MSKKILTLLAPVAALIAFAMVPALAQATTAQAPNGTKLAAGAAVTAQSTNLVTDTEDEDGTKGTTLECKHAEFKGEVISNGGEDVTGAINSSTLKECVAGVTADIFTNAGEEVESTKQPWILQGQQPDANGDSIVHILPYPGKAIQFTVQPQFIGSVTTCDYSAPSVQGLYQNADQILHITGARHFMRQTGSSPTCRQYGTLQGQLSLKAGANGIMIDMT